MAELRLVKMINAEINVGKPDAEKLTEMRDWCTEKYGRIALWKDAVNQYSRWTLSRKNKDAIFLFYKEEEATLFALRWAS